MLEPVLKIKKVKPLPKNRHFWEAASQNIPCATFYLQRRPPSADGQASRKE